MKTILFLVFVVVPIILASGCGTICNFAGGNPDVYGGFQKDIKYMQTPPASSTNTIGITAAPVGMIKLAATLADSGLSLVADTLTLPVVLQLRRSEPEETKEQP